MTKKGIFWDVDGSLGGVTNSYTTWNDRFTVHSSLAYPTSRWWHHESKSILATVLESERAPALERRIHNCPVPFREYGIVLSVPHEAFLRQLNVTNLDTAGEQTIMLERRSIYG